ncbi:MFS transporter [Glutamicibacter sp. AOP38-B1-38]|uniref:MFS transporter n=1 Tax=Glutamicibacter sp. AOP38-B1-38 TaxID=3457680 RepID=UPI004034D753
MSTHQNDRRTAGPFKVAMASFIGTTIEYYDFFIYGTAAALVFPRLFFPEATPVMGTLLSFATFGVGFLARPLGGIVFGHFGDRIGRKKMLIISLVGMGLATMLMGLLPGYAQIGIAAPILLTLLRLFQGFMVGGEWGGATLMAVEHAPKGKRGFYGAFPQTGAPAGTALATVAFLSVSQLPDEAFFTWGWRLPFLVSAVLVVVGLIIRMAVSESPAFAAARSKDAIVKLPIKEAFKRRPKEIFLIAGTYMSQGVYAYITMSYLVNYASKVVDLDKSTALMGVFIAAVIATVLYPVFGALSDTYGRKTMYLIGALAMGVVTWPAFMLINTGTAWGFTTAVVLLFGIAMPPAAGVTGSLMAMVFSREVRYTGASVGYTLGTLAGPAFAPTIATALFAAYGSSDAVAIYMIIVSVISVVSVSLLPGGWGRKEALYNAESQDQAIEAKVKAAAN